MPILLRLRIVYIGMILGPAMLGAVATFLHSSGAFMPQTDATLAAILGIVVPVAAIGGYGASKVVFERLMEAARARPSLDAKLHAYQTATIIRAAMMEAPALLSFTVFLVFGGQVYALLGFAMLGFMLLFIPSPDGIVMDLHLEADEKRQVRGELP